jgi:hypothetical protein
MTHVLPDLSGHQKLVNMAKTINKLAVAEHDARIEFCKAVAAAQELVRKESNLSFADWADANLRQPDGSKWSLSSLYKAAMFGRAPEKLAAHRARIAEHGNVARRALGLGRGRPGKSMPSAATVADEVARLMFVWRGVSAEAKRQFLAQITKRAAS